MKFKKLKKILSFTDAVQLWIPNPKDKTEEIYTFCHKGDIPKKYNKMKVTGIGTVTGVFYDDKNTKIIGNRAIEVVLIDETLVESGTD